MQSRSLQIMLSLAALAGMTPNSVWAEDCPPALNQIHTADFLGRELKIKIQEGEELPAFTCKKSGEISMGEKKGQIFQLGTAGGKKKTAVLIPPDEGMPISLRSEPRTLEEANTKAFSMALPNARDLTPWKKILRTRFEIQGEDVCAITEGPSGVTTGQAVTCAQTPKKTQEKSKIGLGSLILENGKAQDLALKEFARVEKEEDAPSAKEIFGDKDTAWKLALGATVKTSCYVGWMSQFSGSGIIVMAIFMDGSAKSDVIKDVFEYDNKVVSTHLQKWLK